MTKITKLVLPVAGVGERLKPLTLNCPKALVKVNGQCILDYALDEAKGTNINEVILIISPQHKEFFEKYLRDNRLRFSGLIFHIRIQEEPFGSGHAVLQAKDFVRGEPFIVRYVDDLLIDKVSPLRSFSEIFDKYLSPVLILGRVPEEIVSRYGVVSAEKLSDEGMYKIGGLVEKPKREEAPSNLTVIGGYVLTPEVFRFLEELEKSYNRVKDGFKINDAFNMYMANGGDLYGWEFLGKRLDCGTLEGLEAAGEYLKSNR